MGNYLKRFENHAQYEYFTTDTENFIKPNVSICITEGDVHYNPYIDPYNGYKYVDLGLSVKWATMNVGASSESDNGLYFSWANVEGHTKSDGYDFSQSTYDSTSGSSVSVNITVDSGYDAARVNMGGKWRMPTKDEFQELYDNCTWTWTTVNDVNGYMVTSKTNSNSIFLPAAGYCNNTTLYNENNQGFYWSSNFATTSDAYYMKFVNNGIGPQYGSHRYNGYSIRAVAE